VQGTQGAQGAQGTNITSPGPSGTKGPAGAQGAQGSDGPPGPSGSMGATGAVGAQGAQGDTGPAGVTCNSFVIFGSNTQSDICNGLGSALTVYSSVSASCGYIPGDVFFLDLTNCQNQFQDWNFSAPGYEWYTCDGPPRPFEEGQLNSTGDFVSSQPCGPSDSRLKKGVETLTNSLEKLMMIDAVEYDWNNKLREYDSFKEQEKLHTIGLIAQEVKEYFPQVISINPDGYYWIDYNKLNAVLVEAIKEQQVFIEDIDKELEFIESKLR
jgi:hypothetical protein